MSRTVILRRIVIRACIYLSAVVLYAQSGIHAQGRPAYEPRQYANVASSPAQANPAVPGNADALLSQGKALARQARLPQAERAFTEYLQNHPHSSEALEALAIVQEREDKPADSLKTFTRAARWQTLTSTDLDFVGLDYVLLKDYPDAIHWLRQAIAFDVNNGRAWYHLGRCYYTQNHFPDALAAFHRAKALMPDDPRVLENLGLTLEAENHPSEAERQYRKAVQLAHNGPASDEWPYLNYGSFLLGQDRAAEAVPQLEAAVGANPKCAACRAMLGRALASTGKVTAGMHELEQAVTLAPNDPTAHFQLGRVYQQAGDHAHAKEQFALSAKLYGSQAHEGPIQ